MKRLKQTLSLLLFLAMMFLANDSVYAAKKSASPVLSAINIVLLLVAGGVFGYIFWKKRQDEE